MGTVSTRLRNNSNDNTILNNNNNNNLINNNNNNDNDIAKMYGKQDKFGIDQGEMTDSNAAAAMSEYSDDYVGNSKPDPAFSKPNRRHTGHSHPSGNNMMMFPQKHMQG